MKKKICGAMVVVAITLGAMINVNLNKLSNKGDLALTNVEALAEGEDNVRYNVCVICPPCVCSYVITIDGKKYTVTTSGYKNI